MPADGRSPCPRTPHPTHTTRHPAAPSAEAGWRGAGYEEGEEEGEVALEGSLHEGGVAARVVAALPRQLRARLAVQQPHHQPEVVVGGVVKRRKPPAVPLVGVRAAAEELLDAGRPPLQVPLLAVEDRVVHRRAQPVPDLDRAPARAARLLAPRVLRTGLPLRPASPAPAHSHQAHPHRPTQTTLSTDRQTDAQARRGGERGGGWGR
eukprot:360968-Rhodomonas_salina.1